MSQKKLSATMIAILNAMIANQQIQRKAIKDMGERIERLRGK